MRNSNFGMVTKRCYNRAFSTTGSPRVSPTPARRMSCEDLLMKRAIHPALICSLLFLLLILPAIAESAKSLYAKGKIAEARQNYEQAYDFFKQAYDQKPQDISYRSAYERLRFLAGASHVHRGQLLREAGRLEEALAEFQKAAEI